MSDWVLRQKLSWCNLKYLEPDTSQYILKDAVLPKQVPLKVAEM